MTIIPNNTFVLYKRFVLLCFIFQTYCNEWLRITTLYFTVPIRIVVSTILIQHVSPFWIRENTYNIIQYLVVFLTTLIHRSVIIILKYPVFTVSSSRRVSLGGMGGMKGKKLIKNSSLRRARSS